jgi:transposase
MIVLVLDNAGWHGEAGLTVPDGVRLVFLPPYTPELQPAETLWTLVDEPIVNKHIATINELDDIIGRRCAALANERDIIRRRREIIESSLGVAGFPRLGCAAIGYG